MIASLIASLIASPIVSRSSAEIAGDVARTVMLLPASTPAETSAREAWYYLVRATRTRTQTQTDPYSEPKPQPQPAAPAPPPLPTQVDSASSQLLYNEGWLLRAAPLSMAEHLHSRRTERLPSRRNERLHSRRLRLIPVAPPYEPNASAVMSAAAAADDTRAVVGAPSFWLVDHSTGRMLYWADTVVRVRPLVRDPNLGWRLRRLSDSACPHWASAGLRRNQTSREWARRLVHTARGECAGECPTSALVGQVMV